LAYEPTIWKNREVEKPRTFTLQDNGDGTTTLIPAEGKVSEAGTPIMAANMNKIEEQLVESDNHINDNSQHLQVGERVNWNSKQDGFKYYGSLKDLNEIKEVGDYASAFFTNKPDGLYEYALLSLRVEKYSTDWVRQVITYFDESATAYRQWERAYTAGTAWSSWREISYSKLFTSVSNGKATVNQAVTDMGVYTAPDASFATTAANIRNLSNIVVGVGTITNNGTQTFFNVTGLSFKPRAYMFRTRGGNIPGSWGVYNSTFSASDFVVVINHSSYGNVSSVFDGGFTVAAAYPAGTGQFDWWAIK